MLRLAWLTIAQHVFQPALTGGELAFTPRLGEIWNLSVATTTGAWTWDCVSRTDIGDFRPERIFWLLIYFLCKFCLVLGINSIHSIDCILEKKNLVKIVQFDNDRVPVSANSLEPLGIKPCVTRRSWPTPAFGELVQIL